MPEKLPPICRIFRISVREKSVQHPLIRYGSRYCYVVEGMLPGFPITLTRGKRYLFRMGASTIGHPFYLDNEGMGGPQQVHNGRIAPLEIEGVTHGDLQFIAPLDGPDSTLEAPTIFAACSRHEFMGFPILLRNEAPPDEDEKISDCAFCSAPIGHYSSVGCGNCLESWYCDARCAHAHHPVHEMSCATRQK